MTKRRMTNYVGFVCILFSFWACKMPAITTKTENKSVPTHYYNEDTTNVATIKWREYFTDPSLVALIDTALRNNQELNIMLREIEMSKNEIKARKGEYLPFASLRG